MLKASLDRVARVSEVSGSNRVGVSGERVLGRTLRSGPTWGVQKQPMPTAW